MLLKHTILPNIGNTTTACPLSVLVTLGIEKRLSLMTVLSNIVVLYDPLTITSDSGTT